MKHFNSSVGLNSLQALFVEKKTTDIEMLKKMCLLCITLSLPHFI